MLFYFFIIDKSGTFFMQSSYYFDTKIKACSLALSLYYQINQFLLRHRVAGTDAVIFCNELKTAGASSIVATLPNTIPDAGLEFCIPASKAVYNLSHYRHNLYRT
jgi:hypothetical protein